jgi:hypothetical protein
MRPEDLTPPQQAELLHAFQDHPRFCRESLQIRDLGGSRIPMVLSPGQLKLHAAKLKQQKAGQPIRIIALKPRRAWFTAGVCAEMFHEVPFFPGRKGLIIADNFDPAALEAFDYMVQFQTGYKPFGMHGCKIKLPRLVKDTEQELRWDNDSGIDVMSAQGGDVGRGGGRHFLLGDEVAFWRSAEKTLTAVLNMVPKLPGTMVVLQSTANGVGGEFYELCQKAMDPAIDSGWQFLFFSWLEHPPYRIGFDSPDAKAKFQSSLDREEQELVAMNAATPEQLAWRRLTIATECRGKVELFHQEYPTTADEAFLSSGRQALTTSTLVRMPVWVNPLVGELQEIEEYPKKKLKFVPRDFGALVIGKKPEPSRSYVLGADPSKGIDVSEAGRGTDPDWSVGIVIDLETGEQVAMLRERLRPVPFAEYLVSVAKLFNYAFLVPEANDAGFIDAIIRTGYPLERIYNKRRDPTDRRSTQPQEIGFETTGTTRPWLISALDDALREMAIIIRSPIVQQEIRTFVIKPNGKQEHQTGCHDDCVMAAALACIGMRFAPRKMKRAMVDQVKAYGSYGKRRVEDDD